MVKLTGELVGAVVGLFVGEEVGALVYREASNK